MFLLSLRQHHNSRATSDPIYIWSIFRFFLSLRGNCGLNIAPTNFFCFDVLPYIGPIVVINLIHFDLRFPSFLSLFRPSRCFPALHSSPFSVFLIRFLSSCLFLLIFIFVPLLHAMAPLPAAVAAAARSACCSSSNRSRKLLPTSSLRAALSTLHAPRKFAVASCILQQRRKLFSSGAASVAPAAAAAASSSGSAAVALKPKQQQQPSSGSSSLGNRGFPEYRQVPFVEEDLEKVVGQVPDFKYYYIGQDSDRVKGNIFGDIPLDQGIFQPNELKEYTPPNCELQYSRLDNGLRIASLDRGGLTASLGLFVHAGSRFEDASNFGVSHMLQTLAFSSTAHLSLLRTVKTIEVLGANAGCLAGREHLVYSADCLRTQMPLLVPLLTGNVLFPRLLPWELKANKEKLLMARRRLEHMPDQMVSELLHTTAWHNNTLGHKLYCTERSLQHYDSDTIRQYMLQHFSPDNMVFVGVNVNHDELCNWLMRAFVYYNAIPPTPRTVATPVYSGGDVRMESASPHSHIAVAFETPGGWNSGDLVAYSVLQTIIGGGGAFSTGGPGKGMYTRLYLNVLNENDWVESAMAFNTQYTDSGIFGLYMLVSPNKACSAVEVMAREFGRMERVGAEELQRAKNCLKASIHMNLECRGIVMEDVGRQLLMSRRVISPQEFCSAIDAVTEKDIERVVRTMYKKAPTVVVYGDTSTAPHYEEIRGALRAAGAVCK